MGPGAEGQGYHPEQLPERRNSSKEEMREEVEENKQIMTRVASELDQIVSSGNPDGTIATLTQQIRLLYRHKLIPCCEGGKLDVTRAQGIMDELIDQMKNEKTKEILRNIKLGRNYSER